MDRNKTIEFISTWHVVKCPNCLELNLIAEGIEKEIDGVECYFCKETHATEGTYEIYDDPEEEATNINRGRPVPEGLK